MSKQTKKTELVSVGSSASDESPRASSTIRAPSVPHQLKLIFSVCYLVKMKKKERKKEKSKGFEPARCCFASLAIAAAPVNTLNRRFHQLIMHIIDNYDKFIHIHRCCC